MRIGCAALVALIALGACVVVPPEPARAPVPQVVVPSAPAGPRLSASASVAQFRSVVQTVEPVAEAECRRRQPLLNCDFRIVVDDRPGQPPNAYQTLDPQGRPIIAFTVPLLADVRNPDELAFVMSHEAAHHIAGHLARQRQNATVGAVVFGQLAGVVGAGDPEAIRTAQQIGAAVGARSYSKDFELEADRLGTIIAARAGFNPVRGAEFFFRIPDPGDRFLGTHPANAERVEMVRRTAAGL